MRKYRALTCFECIDCNTIYKDKNDATKCKCSQLCSSDTKGHHYWEYLYSVLGVAFYKCKNCEKELMGQTAYIKKPSDEIMIRKLKSKKFAVHAKSEVGGKNG